MPVEFNKCFSIPVVVGQLLAIALLCCAAATVKAQAVPGGIYRYPGGLTVNIGVTNTQFPYYADNAAGGSISLFTQRRFLMGSQLKFSSYPATARFWQSPITAGYRVGRSAISSDAYGLRHLSPIAYAGAGFSRSHDSNNQYASTPGEWNRCLEGSAGIDVPYEHFTLRLADVSYVRTFTPVRQLATYAIGMGVTLHLHR